MKKNILHTQFEELQDAKEALIGNIDRYTEAEQQFKPNPNKWNMLEIVEHLLIAETGTVAFFTKYDPGTTSRKAKWNNFWRSPLLNLWLKSPIKAKAPNKLLNPKGDISFEEMTSRWLLVRDQLKEIIDEFPEDKMDDTVFKHPLAGPLTMHQTLKFMTLHIVRHTEQVKKLADKAKLVKS